MTRLAVLAALVALTGCAPAGHGAGEVTYCHEARAVGISLPERYITRDPAGEWEPWLAFERPCVP